MTDGWNGFSLLGGNGGKERTSTAKQDVFILPGFHFLKQISAKYNRAASTAGAAGMDILFLEVKYQHTAILVFVTKTVSFSAEQVMSKFKAYLFIFIFSPYYTQSYQGS